MIVFTARSDDFALSRFTAIEFHLRIRNTGVCEIIAGGDSMRLVTFNALPHLDAPGRRDAITFA